MFRKLTLSAAIVLGLASGAQAAGGGESHVEDFAFSFEGPFGSYDQMQLQRGLKIYTEVCAACHGMEFVRFGTLADEGGPHLPEDQVYAYAGNFEVWDPTLAGGDGDYRPATPADKFPGSSMSNAPDLSLMAKARAGFHGPYGLGINQIVKGMGGPEYIASLLHGYHEAPECAPEDFPGYYNTVFETGGFPNECKDEHGNHLYPGSWIAMPQPLLGEDVDFDDEHSNELEHEIEDISAFLMWAAEPKLNARKTAGLTGVIFLIVLSVLLYATNKRIWAPHKNKKH
ncbi:cytochrome c1 [Marivivens donghaensis]|uniref:Cytochrome c1 n=1 Tax=Marivivens donghaensis TaxID=1699413 RepID=A0ABX0VXB6_9RHOB|nr:cytochrome c1 [Marivivens donghaensis]NIY71544.1 cytochrome c1 [Marivivens donghaensis]